MLERRVADLSNVSDPQVAMRVASMILRLAMQHQPKPDSPEKLHEQGLQRLSEAEGKLEQKATPDELEGYRAFVLNLASRVAHAHEEGDEKVSASEQAAIDEITASLGTPGGA